MRSMKINNFTFFIFDLNMVLLPCCLTGPSEILLNNIGKCGCLCFTFLSRGKNFYIFCVMLDEFAENALFKTKKFLASL